MEFTLAISSLLFVAVVALDTLQQRRTHAHK
jgi:hypothetical protein